MRGSHTCRLASEIVRSSHRPAPCTRSCWSGSAGEVSVPSIPSDARPAASVIVPVSCGNRPAGTHGEPSNAVMRKVPSARGCPVRSSSVPAERQFRRRVEKDIGAEPVESAARHDTEAVFEVVAWQAPLAAQVGPQSERLGGAQGQVAADSSVRSVHFDGVEIEPPARQAERSLWLRVLRCAGRPVNVSAISPSRKCGAVMCRPAGRKYGRLLGLRRPFLERHFQARHRQSFEPEVTDDQAARFGIHGQAARDDVRCFVIDDDAVCRQRSGDRASRATHFDLDGGQAVQLRDCEIQALLREQQPVQEHGDATGQRQQQSDQHQ